MKYTKICLKFLFLVLQNEECSKIAESAQITRDQEHTESSFVNKEVVWDFYLILAKIFLQRILFFLAVM